MNKSELKHWLRNTPGISKVYRHYVDRLKGSRFRTENLPSVIPYRNENNNPRLNLVLPVFEKDFVYGGISTTLKIMLRLAEKTNMETRIIILNGSYSKKATYKIEGFNIAGDDASLFFLNDNSRKIGIRKNDIFIGTMWTTIYPIRAMFNYQKKNWKIGKRKFIYLIQDYEPGFYQWSSEYALCENTYIDKTSDIIAVFNAESLYQYFKINNYSFSDELWFDPVINDVLREKLETSVCRKKREKVILLYGRPRVERNAFDLLRFSLKKWSKEYLDSKNWRIVSLGADFDSIKLENNTIECGGKLSLEEYADIMLNSYAAISLMISPHPSYPPLEFSTFGVRTITNEFANKNLSAFNDNIISIRNCSPENIIYNLITLCREHDKYESSFGKNETYLHGDSFEKLILELSNKIKEMI